eukprot:CAMPEP_0181210540 /NCGR_PEP_ID=MMETSP1096-20121128/23285_1 /TAXON_ID=156174 ORGANISM="Chrysochromulina ericina, Strain CCMP281" /NCGR_SAMPLE_ID=MMETSP1096 /ASSEMBLY_ACC=CAM_ASM_000453 /LENGTH=50 /DNA_ID=CAMNT_0023301837 /DNA_START=216 /DNA_END=368 /DNA_ORIENTATION=+
MGGSGIPREHIQTIGEAWPPRRRDGLDEGPLVLQCLLEVYTSRLAMGGAP